MSRSITGIVNWLKNWFYDKGQVDTYLNAKVNSNQGQANYNVVTDSNGNIGLEPKPTIPDVTVKADKTGGVQQVTDANAHGNIGTSSGATQGAINTAIDSVIGSLSSIRAIEVTSDKGTASADKLGRLFIVSENSKVNIYYVKQSGSGSATNYSWEKMDTDILDEYVVNWDDVTGKPSSFKPISHASTSNTYGVATDTLYSHTKIRDNLTASTLVTGESLSSHQGYVLKGLIDDLEDTIVDFDATTIPFSPNTAYWGDYSQIANTISNALNTLKMIQNSKCDVGDCITSIELVPKTTDSTGAIKLYYGDEP